MRAVNASEARAVAGGLRCACGYSTKSYAKMWIHLHFSTCYYAMKYYG